MYHPFRGPLGTLLAVLLVGAAPLSADAAPSARILPRPDHRQGEFTRSEARDVLAQARRLLRTDTGRVRARKPVGHGTQTEITMTLRDLFLARSELTGDERRAAEAMLSRSRVFTDGGDDPITLNTPSTRCSTNFCVHYRPTSMAPASESATTAHVQTTLDTLEQVRSYETQKLGYRAPVADTPAVATGDNPDSRFDVFLGNIAQQGLYGYCSPDGDLPATTDGHAAAFCVLDNNYAAAEYGTAPLNALRATAAHEFFHAIQFAYDVFEDLWFMEGTAAWVEDEVYDSINDNYQYLAESSIREPRRAVDYSIGMHPYGAFLFFKYAAERLRTPVVVRQFWEYAEASRNRYSLQAIRAVMAARVTGWPAFFSTYASWNTLPGASYSERAAYPAPVLTFNRTLAKKARSTGWRSVALPHLSSSSIRVTPGRKLSPRKNLLIEVNAPDTSHGSAALVQRRFRNGAVTHSMMALNGFGNGRLLIRFDRRALASVYVVVANTSTAMRDCGRIGDGWGGPVYACYGRGYYDQAQTFVVRATVR